MFPEFVKNKILQHLTTLENDISHFFLNSVKKGLIKWVIHLNCHLKKITDDCQDEFLQLKTNSGAKDLFDEKSDRILTQDVDFLPKSGKKTYSRIASISVVIFLWIRIFSFVANENEVWKWLTFCPFEHSSVYPITEKERAGLVSYFL